MSELEETLWNSSTGNLAIRIFCSRFGESTFKWGGGIVRISMALSGPPSVIKLFLIVLLLSPKAVSRSSLFSTSESRDSLVGDCIKRFAYA